MKINGQKWLDISRRMSMVRRRIDNLEKLCLEMQTRINRFISHNVQLMIGQKVMWENTRKAEKMKVIKYQAEKEIQFTGEELKKTNTCSTVNFISTHLVSTNMFKAIYFFWYRVVTFFLFCASCLFSTKTLADKFIIILIGT